MSRLTMKVSELSVLDKFVSAILRYSMLTRGDRVGAAVSGGADSVCLLHLLREIAEEWRLELVALHLDHGLRGEESDGDRRFVEEIAARAGVPVVAERVDVSALGGNLEAAAREARRAFFGRAMRERGLRRVATGHTLNDQAETVLFRAVRGCAPGGLRGILPVTSEGLIRPMLQVSRAEVEQWLRGRGIAWREDSSNADVGFRRNAIRHEVLPALASSVNARAVEALARLGAIAGEEEQVWERWVGERFDAVFERKMDGALVGRVEEVRGMERPVARRVLARAFRECGCGAVGSEHLETALARVEEGKGGVHVGGGGMRVSVGWVRVSARKDGGAKDRWWSVGVTGEGVFARPQGDLVLAVRVAAGNPYNERGSRLDRSLIANGLVYRGWLPGDRLGDKKLKSMLQRAGIPVWDRTAWPVLESGGRVAWAGGFGAAEWARAAEDAPEALEIEEVTAKEALE